MADAPGQVTPEALNAAANVRGTVVANWAANTQGAVLDLDLLAMIEQAALNEITRFAAQSAAEATTIIKECWGALNFILAFYEPGQRYLDTNAWKQAEASGRHAHAKARMWIDALDTGKPATIPPSGDAGERFAKLQSEIHDLCPVNDSSTDHLTCRSGMLYGSDGKALGACEWRGHIVGGYT